VTAALTILCSFFENPFFLFFFCVPGKNVKERRTRYGPHFVLERDHFVCLCVKGREFFYAPILQ
jgi:hypothetical protein